MASQRITRGRSNLRVALIVNPAAGKGAGARVASVAEKMLRERGAELLRLQGETPQETVDAVQRAIAAAPDVIAIVGGDGTLSLGLQALVEAAVPVALIPAGTGNDLARELGFPGRTDEAVAAAVNAIMGGKLRSINVGAVSCAGVERLFTTVVALGFDAQVNERTNTLRWPSGAARYYLALLIELLRLRAIPFSVSLDRGPSRLQPGTLLAVANTKSYGGGMPIAPAADPQDGQFDVVHVAPLSRLRLLRLFPLLLRGKHVARGEVRVCAAREAEVSAPELVVYADGERVGSGPARVWMTPHNLQMCVN